MDARTPVRSLRLGDPLRRVFLEELARRVPLPRPLAGEWALARADLTVALADDDRALVFTAGSLGGERRWVRRLRLDDPETWDLALATASALDHVALLRPEHASVPKGLALAIRRAVAPVWVDDEPGEAPDGEWFDEDDEDAGDYEGLSDAAPPSPPIPPRPVPPRPSRRRRRNAARVLAGFVVVAGAGVAGVVAILGDGAGRGSGGSTATGPEPTAAAARAPGYAVQLRNPDGSPVRFDPCRTYEYVVQPGALAPEEAAAEAGAAFAALEEATDVAFRLTGFSDARFPYPIDAEHLPRLPILVSYERAADSPALREGSHEHGSTESRPLGGLAVGTPVQVRPGLTVVAGGAVVIDEDIAPDQRARVLLHELGHLAGLGHTGDTSQMMAPAVPDDGPVAYREGDRAGLAELGASGGCALTDAERSALFG